MSSEISACKFCRKCSVVNLICAPGEVDRVAVIAHKVYAPVSLLTLEYDFLRFVVHAGLAKVVRASGGLARLYLGEDKGALRKLMKIVLRPFRAPLFKLGDLCTEFSLLVFERINLIASRRVLLLQLERGVCDLEDLFIQHLLHVGEFQVVTCRNCRFCKIDRGSEGGERSAQCGDRFHGFDVNELTVGGGASSGERR